MRSLWHQAAWWVPLLLAIGAHAKEPTAKELLDRTDDLLRGSSSVATVTMHVKTARWERTLSMKAWSKGKDYSLIRILSPAKERGIATLKVQTAVWNYLPKVDRTIKVPASMMATSWMGSHFTNDDLVRESRMADDYTYEIVSRPQGPSGGLYVIELVPKAEAAVVWGKVIVSIRASDELPTDVRYFDEKGVLVRTMTYEDVRDFGRRKLPSLLRVVPADKPDEVTEVRYDALDLDVDLPTSAFSLQALRQ